MFPRLRRTPLALAALAAVSAIGSTQVAAQAAAPAQQVEVIGTSPLSGLGVDKHDLLGLRDRLRVFG